VIVMLFSLLFLSTVLLWVVKSIQILGPKEMAVLLFLGKPVAFCNSGIHFIPFLLYSLAKRPKKMFNLDYLAREVITKKGTYNGVKYGAQVLKADVVAYLSLPRGVTKNEGNLIKIVESDVPYDEEGLKNWTEDSVVGSLRAVFADMTWMEAIEKIEDLKKKTEKKFQDADGALVKVGFDSRDLKLVIKEVKLPKELEESLIAPDRERLKKDAADFKAQTQAMEWVGMIFHAMALAEGKTIKQIQNKIKSDEELQKKFVDYALKINNDIEMADRKAIFKFINEGKDGAGVPGNIALFGKLLEIVLGKGRDEKSEKKEEAAEKEEKAGSERISSAKEQRIMKSAGKALRRRKKKSR